MSDSRVQKFAKVLVEHSARIVSGDRVLIEASTLAAPLVRELIIQVLEKGGHPQPLIMLPEFNFPEHEELLLTHGNDVQIEFVPSFFKLAYDEFESRIRVHSAANPRDMTLFDTARMQQRGKAKGAITDVQMKRGATGALKWVTTLYPTQGYAQDAGMSLKQYEDFVFNAVHANEDDPIAFWNSTAEGQQKAIDFLKGKDKVTLKGPNVDLSLSIKDRKFMNSTGTYNMPDGEIYTGPVEQSLNGWVRYTYPALYGGVAVEGAELKFKEGRVEQATATKNQDYLLKMLDTDAGSRFVGEFAIGSNYDIDKFTGNILFDEKIGGTFHMALGAGYPETGSHNKSAIHWDMICDLRTDSEIRVDGELFYKNGEFVFGK